MKVYKIKDKYCKLFLLMLCVFLFPGYMFPEKLPAPFDFDTYTFEKIKFAQTSVNEFAYLAPNYNKPTVEGIYTIYTEKDLNNTYKSLRAGFKDNFLDWIELEFAVPQSWSKFKQVYGKPTSVNTEYSKKYNYQDYGYFNVVTDKNNASAFAVTLYAESDFNSSIARVVNKLPDYKSFNFIKEFLPGQLVETDFNSTYTNFAPKKNSADSTDNVYSIPLKYLKHNTCYSGADLVFKNGILAFVNLKPKTLSIIEIKQIYGEGQTTNSSKPNIFYMEYPNFVVTYDKTTNKVLNIGIIGAN